MGVKDTPFQNFKSLVLVAIPKPAFILPFYYRGKRRQAILPPTYVDYHPTFRRVRDDAFAAISGGQYRIEILRAPLKSLAVLTGLVKYGRNNVTYHSELGSFIQLVGLIADMELEAATTGSSVDAKDNLMKLCETCRACIKACPTGAIDEKRVLLHAEKCYTPISESAGKLPDSPLPPSPECVVGCMTCQNVCPMNKGKLRHEEVEFYLSEEEISFILCSPDKNAKLWQQIKRKFDSLGLTEGIDIYARNLKRLVKFLE